ncbi:universal stress protein [Natronococcus wangiae]|uniref:universal stress protein n=1 Tax=Natronococcus wangiae TaxID=3068275 RepID=UPI0027402C27|nr:universal stress protein [Natronococcus sp. AD5]
MTDSVLVPVDGSDPAMEALEHALDIAVDTDASVHALYVADTNQPSLVRISTQIIDALEEEGEEIIDHVRSRAEDRDVSVTDHVVQGSPRKVILEYADTHDVDLIVMGAHGQHGLGEYFFGSTTEHIVHQSEVPVLTVRAGEDATRSYPYSNVLVPTDDSAHARAALDLGSAIADRHDATLHLLFVVDELSETIDLRSPPLSEDVERNARELLEKTAARTDLEENRVTMAVEAGSVPHEIVSYTESNAVDLVVMGTHGMSGLDQFLLGSFTERVIRMSPVPVLTTTSQKE